MTIVVDSGPGGDEDTIQDGVAAAGADGTVEVKAGTYAEEVVVDKKNLTLEGPQAGVNPCNGRTGSEAVVGKSSGGIRLEADGITVDGFTVTNVAQGHGEGGMTTAKNNSGYTIRNNIIEGNELGLLLRSEGTNRTIVENNEIKNNKDPDPGAVSKGIVTGFDIFKGELKNTVIRENCFSGHVEGGNSYAIQLVNFAGLTHKQVTIKNNTLNDSSILLNSAEDVIVEGNEHDMSSDTDSDSILFLGGAVDGVTIRTNTLKNAPTRAIGLTTVFASGLKNVSIIGNSFENNPTDIECGLNFNGGYDANSVEIKRNNFSGSNFGVENTLTSGKIVDATDNWWGAADGPSGGVSDPETTAVADGSGVPVSSGVKFDPWNGGQSLIVDGDLTTDSDGDSKIDDFNGDGRQDPSDIVEMVDKIQGGGLSGLTPSERAQLDHNGDGNVDKQDAWELAKKRNRQKGILSD